MRRALREGAGLAVGLLTAGRLATGCATPDGAIRRCEAGTVADQAAQECVEVSAGSGGQGGAAGGGGAPGSCAIEQLASDPKNCGECGRDCRGAACRAGACEPEAIAERLVAPFAVALTASEIVWASPAKGVSGNAGAGLLALARPGPPGATPSTLLGAAAARTRGLATSAAGEVFWAELATGVILRGGSGATQATEIASGRANVNRLVIAGEYLYWTEGGLGAGAPAGGVFRAPLGNGGVEELARAQARPDALAVDGENVYWVNRGPGGQVMRAARGGAPEIIERLENPAAVAASAGAVVWADRASGRVAARASGEATVTTVARDAGELVEGLAVEGRAVYRVAYRQTEKALLVKRSDIGGAGEVVLGRITPSDAAYVGNPLGAYALAFDDLYLYFADPGAVMFDAAGVPLSQQNGRLYRVAK